MRAIRLSVTDFKKLVSRLGKGDLSVVGRYRIGKFHVQVSEFGLDTNDRVSRLYHRRRSKFLCISCGKKVRCKNPRTGLPYRLCNVHRKVIDGK